MGIFRSWWAQVREGLRNLNNFTMSKIDGQKECGYGKLPVFPQWVAGIDPVDGES